MIPAFVYPAASDWWAGLPRSLDADWRIFVPEFPAKPHLEPSWSFQIVRCLDFLVLGPAPGGVGGRKFFYSRLPHDSPPLFHPVLVGGSFRGLLLFHP